MTYLRGHKSDEIRALQVALSNLGLYTYAIDGGFGDETFKAVVAAQELYGLEPRDGVVRAELLLELGIIAPKPAPHFNPINPKGTIMGDLLGGLFHGLLGNLLNWQLVQGYIRSGLIGLGSWIGLDGFVGHDGTTIIIGSLMTIAGVVFQAISNNTKAKAMDVVKAVDAAPDVALIPADKTSSGKPVVKAAL